MATIRCSTVNCDNASLIRCFKCEKNYCREHSDEHEKELLKQLDTIGDQIRNDLHRYDRLNVSQMVEQARTDLQRWREVSLRTIEEMFTKKSAELTEISTEKLPKSKKQLERIDTKFKEFRSKNEVKHQDLEGLIEAIRHINETILKIEQNGVQLDIPSISFQKPNEDFFSVAAPIKNEHFFDLPLTYRLFNCPNQSGFAMAGNDQSLLVVEDYQLILLDESLVSVQQVPWRSELIEHLSWIEQLKHFLLITSKRKIYMISGKDLTKFEEMKMFPRENWFSSCSNAKSLFLSTWGQDPSIVQFNLDPSFRQIQRWGSPNICQHDECLHQINAVGQTDLLLLLSQSLDKSIRLELRSINQFHVRWFQTLTVPQSYYQKTIHSTFIPSRDQFCLVLENSSELIQVNKDGLYHMIEHSPSAVWNVTFFNRNKLILRSDKHLFVYQI